jgi:hypothetical protein
MTMTILLAAFAAFGGASLFLCAELVSPSPVNKSLELAGRTRAHIRGRAAPSSLSLSFLSALAADRLLESIHQLMTRSFSPWFAPFIPLPFTTLPPCPQPCIVIILHHQVSSTDTTLCVTV